MKVMWKIAALVLVLFPAVVFAQGRVAVVNLEEAILQTDYAQAQLELIESDEEFKSNKAEFDQLQADLQKIAEDFQRDSAAMSEEQKAAVRQKVASKQSDIEYVGKKLQAMQQQGAQQILQELVPQAREVLRDIIATDQIGLLLQQQSVIHADMSYSITAKVTDKLNQLKAK